MPQRLPDDVVHRILIRLSASESVPSIASAVGVARETVYRIERNIELWGTPYPPPTVKLGRPRLLLPCQEEKLMEFLSDRPTAYLDEMQQFIYDEYDGLEVSISCIRRVLDREKWSRKKTQNQVLKQNATLRNAWQGIQKTWSADQLVFLDESGANEWTGDRKYEWSLIGMKCIQSRPIRCSKRWSILPALTIDGYLDYIIHHGAITADLFIEFMEEKVLPYCSLYPGPRSILILDNASIHKDPRLQQLCNDAGVLLKFLPPYSPDYNPIEATFGDLKAWIKRNYMLAADFEVFSGFLDFAVQQVCKNRMEGHFRTAGYILDDELLE